MFRRLLLLLIFGAIVTGAVRMWRKIKFATPPEVPDEWDALARRDSKFKESLELRARLMDLARRRKGQDRRALFDDTHAVSEAIAKLVQIREDLSDYLQQLNAAGRSAKARETIAELERRRGTLKAEIAHAVDDLRQTYADLLAASEGGAGLAADATESTRDLLAELRQRAGAEREIRTFMKELDEN